MDQGICDYGVRFNNPPDVFLCVDVPIVEDGAGTGEEQHPQLPALLRPHHGSVHPHVTRSTRQPGHVAHVLQEGGRDDGEGCAWGTLRKVHEQHVGGSASAMASVLTQTGYAMH